MTELEQYELNRPLTQKDVQRLAGYRTRLAEADQLREKRDTIWLRWDERQQQQTLTHKQDPASGRAADEQRLSVLRELLADLSRPPDPQDVDLEERARLLAELEAQVQQLTDQLQGSTPDERAQVSELEGQVRLLILDEGNRRDFQQLEAREARPEQLREQAAGWLADSLQKIDLNDTKHPLAQLLRGRGHYATYNLPARIAEYEQGKRRRVMLPQELPPYVNKTLERVNQDLDELEKVAARGWPNDWKMAEMWAGVMAEVLNRFKQYVVKDLAEPVQAPASLPTSPAESQAVAPVAGLLSIPTAQPAEATASLDSTLAALASQLIKHVQQLVPTPPAATPIPADKSVNKQLPVEDADFSKEGEPIPPFVSSPIAITEIEDFPEAPTIVGGYDWTFIDDTAERINLRENGSFKPASNRIQAAVAGFIDGLRNAGKVSETLTLPVLYADFTQHYGRKVGADRMTDTRSEWLKKTRKHFGLDG